MKELICITFILLLVSCKEKTSENQELVADFELEEISESEADSMNLALFQNRTGDLYDSTAIVQPTGARRGASERQWRFLLKDVFQSYTFRNPVYLGNSNRKGIGTILDNKQEIERILSQIVPDTTYRRFLTEANPGSLQAFQSKDFNFNLMVDANALGIDAGVVSAITRADSSRLLGGSWEIYDLIWGNLRDEINKKSNPELIKYANDLNKSKNKIISKVIKITGFRSEIYTNSDINTELKAKIDSASGTINNTDAKVNFKVLNNKTILAESTGHFFVYGVLSKKKVH